VCGFMSKMQLGYVQAGPLSLKTVGHIEFKKHTATCDTYIIATAGTVKIDVATLNWYSRLGRRYPQWSMKGRDRDLPDEVRPGLPT